MTNKDAIKTLTWVAGNYDPAEAAYKALDHAIAVLGKAKSPGRPCWFKHWQNSKDQPWQRGLFHTFAQEGECPCAIVEKVVDGSLDTYRVELVNFSEEKPS